MNTWEDRTKRRRTISRDASRTRQVEAARRDLDREMPVLALAAVDEVATTSPTRVLPRFYPLITGSDQESAGLLNSIPPSRPAKRRRSSPTQQDRNAVCQAERSSQSRSSRAGLQFPVGRMSQYLRGEQYAVRVSKGAPVYLAAVLKYLTAEILGLAGAVAQVMQHPRITPWAIQLAVHNDAELHKLLQHVTVAEGGGRVHVGSQSDRGTLWIAGEGHG